jgi:hypothetical protein
MEEFIIKAEKRKGLINKTKSGTEMEIVKVLSYDKIIVQFKDEFRYEKEIHYNNFKRGTVKNPYDKTNCGIGYTGEGEYKTFIGGAGGKHTREYNTWNDMITRCYQEDVRYKHMSYIDCTVCKEWHNFQTFAKWYHKNYYEVNNGRMHLDKDILVENNKVYSPETCVFVPQRINMLFVSKPNKWNLPSGISMATNGKYITTYNEIHLGTFETLETAMIHYNEEKIMHIRLAAEEYKKEIPKKLYKALYRFNGNTILN